MSPPSGSLLCDRDALGARAVLAAGPGSTGLTVTVAGAAATISEPVGAPAVDETDTVGGPSVASTLAVILLPVLIMLARTVVDLTAGAKSEAIKVADFVGDPIIALAIAVAVALAVLWLGRVRSGVSLSESLAPIAGILLIIGAGGGFKQMLVQTGIADSIGKAVHSSHHRPAYLRGAGSAARSLECGETVTCDRRPTSDLAEPTQRRGAADVA